MITEHAASAEPTPRQVAARPLVRVWLLALAALVFAMVVVGGATRLTESGLSITEWAPVTGIVPPMSEDAWQGEFERYRQIPQYQILNRGMSLGEFKAIYWWEWGHRFLGRLVGAVFLLPFLWFLLSGRLERRRIPWLLGAFALGALQGLVGWYMVASGLVERVSVSQYRLAAHLTLAAAIFAYLLWIADGLSPPRRVAERVSARLVWTAAAILALVFVQIALGALVAGLDAGLAYPTWPLMDDRIFPEGLLALDPWWLNAFENITTVQFNHRMGGYLLLALAILHLVDCGRVAGEGRALVGSALLATVTIVQAALGIATLVSGVPLLLALLHQAVAMVVLAAAVIHLRFLAGAAPRRAAALSGVAAIR